jgi:hypothetical protein
MNHCAGERIMAIVCGTDVAAVLRESARPVLVVRPPPA